MRWLNYCVSWAKRVAQYFKTQSQRLHCVVCLAKHPEPLPESSELVLFIYDMIRYMVYDMICDMIYDMIYDIFVNCNWVETRWQ